MATVAIGPGPCTAYILTPLPTVRAPPSQLPVGIVKVKVGSGPISNGGLCIPLPIEHPAVRTVNRITNQTLIRIASSFVCQVSRLFTSPHPPDRRAAPNRYWLT